MIDLELLLSPEVRKFIVQNEHLDPQKLILNPPAHLKEQIKEIADQIISRKKAKAKLPEWYQHQEVVYPPPLSIEQSSSYTTAAYKRSLLKGTHLVDLTGGMGIDTFHLSQNFEVTSYVEQNQWLCELFKHNATVLCKTPIFVHNLSAEVFLTQLKERATFFIDPARRNDRQNKVFRFEECSPNVIELLAIFEKQANQVLIKAAPLIDISSALISLKHVFKVHVVSVKNEVKEILFDLDFKVHEVPRITCVNLETNQAPFSFTLLEEKEQQVPLGNLKKYLYDPNSSITKAGAFKSIAHKYNLEKLGTHTHLYTSNDLNKAFPGRGFEVLGQHVNKRNISSLLPNGKANVFTKNHPLKPEELKKQLKVKDGGEYFLTGYRDVSNKPQVSLVKQVF